MLLLRRNLENENDESYVVLSDGRYVWRIFYAGAGAQKDRPWFWGLEFHEWEGCKGPQYGNAEDREAAMAAFKATWESRPIGGDFQRRVSTEKS
jgi:hypothetical protein